MDIPTQSAILLFIAVFIPLGLVFRKIIRLDIAALLIAACLGIFQVLGFQVLGPAHTPSNAIRAISGFSLPVVITIISLTIVTTALEKTGVINKLSTKVINASGNKVSRTILILSSLSAILSLVMNNIATGALLLPGAIQISRKTKISPSKLLIPIAFGAILGGTATYFTTANIILSDLMIQANPAHRGLNFNDFFPTGGLIAVAGIVFLWLFGNKLLPDRHSSSAQSQAQLTGKELEDFFQIGDRLWEFTLLPVSPFVHQTIRNINFGKRWGITIAAIYHAGEYILPFADRPLLDGDKLLVVGREDRIIGIKELGVAIKPYHHNFYLTEQGILVGEAIISPHSHLINQTIESTYFRSRYGVTVLGIKRVDRSYRTDVASLPLAVGDSLLFVGTSEQISLLREIGDFVVLTTNPSDLPLQKKKAIPVLVVFAFAVMASIAGFPVYLSVLSAGLIIILGKVISMDDIYHSIPWQTIFTIIGMASVSTAIIETGLAAKVGILLKPVSTLGLPALAIAMFIFSGVVTQIVGGQVAALVVGPIAITSAIQAGVNPSAIAVATAIGCSATFILPLSHPVNLLMINPGNYLFRDFFKIGIWLTLLCMVVLSAAMLLFW